MRFGKNDSSLNFQGGNICNKINELETLIGFYVYRHSLGQNILKFFNLFEKPPFNPSKVVLNMDISHLIKIRKRSFFW